MYRYVIATPDVYKKPHLQLAVLLRLIVGRRVKGYLRLRHSLKVPA